MMRLPIVPGLAAALCASPVDIGANVLSAALRRGRDHAARFERADRPMQRLRHARLPHADERTKLLPGRIPGRAGGLPPRDTRRVYTPHSSGADLYPYLILTAHLTDPDLLDGRLLEMLR